jgi:hypothetical protein
MPLIPCEMPENAVFDAPLQVFEDESSWNREVYKEFIETRNPGLAQKMNKLQKLAKNLKTGAVKKTRKKGTGHGVQGTGGANAGDDKKQDHSEIRP